MTAVHDSVAPHGVLSGEAGGSAEAAPGHRPLILAATILASAMAFIDGTIVSIALPAIQGQLRRRVRRAPMGGQRLHADAWQPDPDRRRAGRPARPPQHLPRRYRRLHDRLARLRRGAEYRRADCCARRAGRRRGAARAAEVLPSYPPVSQNRCAAAPSAHGLPPRRSLRRSGRRSVASSSTRSPGAPPSGSTCLSPPSRSG